MFESLLFQSNQRKVQNTLEAGYLHPKKLITLLKVILLPATFGFIIYKLIYAYKIDDLFAEAHLECTTDTIVVFLLVGLLMCGNWILETYKWKLLINKTEIITFKDALKGVVSGITLSIITPNQLGDFVGRIIHLKQTGKIKGTLSAVIGHTAQVIMTFSFGIYGLLFILEHNNVFTYQQALILAGLSGLAIIITIAAFFNIQLLSRLKVSERIKKHLEVFNQYNRAELNQLIVISFIRYLIFMVQYYLLAKLFLVDITLQQALACIAATMCVQSFVPSFILIELGMRGASALWFFGMFTPQVVPVLLTTYVLWMINIMIPGLAGLVFILRWRSVKA